MTGRPNPTTAQTAEMLKGYAEAAKSAHEAMIMGINPLIADHWEEGEDGMPHREGEEPPLMNAEVLRAQNEFETAYSALKALHDRLGLIASAYEQGKELSPARIDAKNRIEGKSIEITVDNSWGEHPINGDWNNRLDLAKSGSYHLSYDAFGMEDGEQFALSLLFESLGFEWNGESYHPVWTVYQTPPAGTITRLRDGLERLGYHYRLWKKRTYRIEAELGDDDKECDYEGANQ